MYRVRYRICLLTTDSSFAHFKMFIVERNIIAITNRSRSRTFYSAQQPVISVSPISEIRELKYENSETKRQTFSHIRFKLTSWCSHTSSISHHCARRVVHWWLPRADVFRYHQSHDITFFNLSNDHCLFGNIDLKRLAPITAFGLSQHVYNVLVFNYLPNALAALDRL